MKATDILRNEHENIKLMLRVIEVSTTRLEIGAQIPPEEMEEIVDFLRVFVHGCHFIKEEDILSMSIESADIPLETGPIGVMIAEHNTAKGLLGDFEEAVGMYKEGDPKAYSKIGELSSEYVKLMTQHINRENNTLFPLAAARLTADEHERLIDKFDALEQEKLGPEVCEKFLVSLAKFRDTYFRQW